MNRSQRFYNLLHHRAVSVIDVTLDFVDLVFSFPGVRLVLLWYEKTLYPGIDDTPADLLSSGFICTEPEALFRWESA